MLTRRGIEANLDDCHAIITMRSPTYIKEVQQIICRLAYLSLFLSCTTDKDFLFFAALKKKEIFKWTAECKEDYPR